MKNKYENIYLVELHDIIYLYKIISLIDSEYENNIFIYVLEGVCGSKRPSSGSMSTRGMYTTKPR